MFTVSTDIIIHEDRMAVKSLQEAVYDQIREAISSGEFGRGERLVEVQLAERFGVTRGPIREALCRLEHDGLVVRHTGIGVFVNEFAEESFQEVCEIRAVLESLAARSAASAARTRISRACRRT